VCKPPPVRPTLPRCAGVSAACIVLAVSTVAADDLSRYREFELGNSLAAVTAVTRTVGRDLKTIHSRPALIQQVEWRPRYMTGAPVAGRESINEEVSALWMTDCSRSRPHIAVAGHDRPESA